MTATVEYIGDLRTTCTHLRSGSLIETDAPVDNNGKGERFSPTDLLATSLGTCMVTVMGIKAGQSGIALNGLKVDVNKIMGTDPRRVTGIDLAVHIPDNLQNLERKWIDTLKHTANTCPVFQSIHPDIKVEIDWGSWS